jgi:hypothetical protein
MNKHDKPKLESGQFDKLEVTIIPVDDEPYSKMINIPSSMMGKSISFHSDDPFAANHQGTLNSSSVAGSATIVGAS